MKSRKERLSKESRGLFVARLLEAMVRDNTAPSFLRIYNLACEGLRESKTGIRDYSEATSGS